MSLNFALSDIELRRVPETPGAIVLFDDVDPLYVAYTANMRAWIRRLLDSERQDNVRAAIARYVADVRKDLAQLRSLPGLNAQVREFLNFCRVQLHPEPTREAAMEQKAALIAALAPKLQATRSPGAVRGRREDDGIVKLLNKVGRLSHIDASGRPRMVDVSAKAATAREAVAAGSVYMAAETLALVTAGKAAKGD